MHSFSIVSVLATIAAVAQAGNVATFKSIDNVDRTVKFVPSEGHSNIASVQVSGGGSVDVDIPKKWVGNAYAYHKGKKDNGGGMLAEFTYDGWNDIHYFDVSAIVDPNDVDNVSEMWPANDPSNTSGCKKFPCDNVYVLPDDVQTKTTKESHIIVTLGMNGGGKKRSAPVPSKVNRSYALLGPRE